MDRNAFDALVRGFGSRRSRRAAAKGLAAGLLGLGTARGAAARVRPEALACGEFCGGDAECNAGLRCGADSEQCFAVPDSKTRCNSNGDCAADYETCNANGRCANTVAPDGCAECRRDGDCAEAGARCTDGLCVAPECAADTDCRRRERCRRGRCVART
jgi:hypothetical protein